MQTKAAVCALIIHPDTHGKHILSISRRDNYKAFGLIGGKVDPGETLEQAVIREVLEETGFEFTILANVFERFCKGKEQDYSDSFTTTTFLGTVNWLPPLNWKGQIEGEGIIKWCTRQELIDGPIGAYNKTLFERIF